ncbi:MAG: GTP-binding protein Obg/CgtA [Monoraphidium minutum]|nr:MAG: GTP-binding protein Obg/CgtA [Monoraphidium minutum]
MVKNLKYKPGGSQPKMIWLPASEPADGADGADVMLVCDPSVDSLLHLHKRKAYAAAKGANGNPAVGSAGPKRNEGVKKAATPPMLISVPPGTVVKKKGSGAVLGELLQPGQRLLVAKGGKGGGGVRAPSREQRQREINREAKLAKESGAEVVSVLDSNWQHDARGLPGQALGLQLLLRVVADVGIVGFPNAGKSSLLAALTRASPAVAPYPFTTLMPNLGVMAAGSGPVLADLPGLIEGAHQGRGLGRVFLRHLRRTRVLLHVVDASAADPATDYWAVREELRMYNPDYCTRPHVVALNKMDLEDAGGLRCAI